MKLFRSRSVKLAGSETNDMLNSCNHNHNHNLSISISISSSILMAKFRNGVTCNHCGVEGHLIRECVKRKHEELEAEERLAALQARVNAAKVCNPLVFHIMVYTV